jgi:high-affinity nickel-transport protein
MAGGVQHRHRHRHIAAMPADPSPTYGRLTAFSIGLLHGIGAETPTQVLLFLAAARAGGTAIGVLLLGCFLVGLLASNTVVALTATFGFLRASRNFALYATTSVVIAGFSLVVGAIFVLGHGAALPALAGG